MSLTAHPNAFTHSSLTRTPAAKAAIFTGTYATLAGLALALAPKSSFGGCWWA